MKKLFILSFLFFWVFNAGSQTLIISEVADGTGTGGYPKYVEILNTGTAAVDLSGLKIRKSVNGGGFSDAFTFPAFSLPAGEYYVVTNIDNVSIGQRWIEFNLIAPANVSYSATNINGNGNDAYALTDASDAVIDIYGEELVDGTGTTWEYTDSYAYRNSNITSPNSTFTQSEWTTVAPNTLDGRSFNLYPYLTPGNPTNDNTSTISAPSSQVPGASIASTETDSIPVLRFDITDAASGDGLPTIVTAIYIAQGPVNTFDFTENLDGGGFYNLTNSTNVTITGEPTVNIDNILIPVNLTVPDGQTVSLEAFVYLNNNNAPDGSVLQFQIRGTSHEFRTDPSGSTFEYTFAGGNFNGNTFTVGVTASELQFVTQPSDVNINTVMTPAVEVAATDSYGNTDVDYTSQIILSYSGTGTMSGTTTVTPVSGVSQFSDLTFDTPETGVNLSAVSGSYNVNSNTFDVNAVIGGSDCSSATSVTVGTHYANHPQGGSGNYDQWYVFSATENGTITVSDCGMTTVDTDVQIIAESCSGTNFDEADDICGTQETLDFDVVAGNDYYIGWGNWDAAGAQHSWTLSFKPAVNILNAYALNNDSIVAFYESPLASVNPSDYTLTATGQTQVNFTQATIDATHDSIVYLKAQNNFAINTIRDNLNDNYNNSTYQFYAGILPVSYTNTANDPDTVRQGYNLTLSGIVTANDNYNQVWIQDSDNPMSGVLIYNSSFDSEVSVGDSIVVTGQKSIFNGLTEIVNPILISSVSGFTPVAANINPADLSYDKTQDDPDAEQWEGQLVQVSGIVIDSLNTSHYEYFGHDCNGNIICFDDDVDYHYGSGFSLTTGSMYSVTGVVTYSYGHYKINPRGVGDATERVRDFTSVAAEPDSQVPTQTTDATVPVDSLHAIEVFKFKIIDEGSDGLPTKLSQFDLYFGPQNTVNFDNDEVAGGWFDFGDANNPIVFSQEPDFDTDHFIFYTDPETAVIDNGTEKEVILHLWFDYDLLQDDAVLQLMLKSDPHGFVADCMNSQFVSTFSADITGGEITLDKNVSVEKIDGNTEIYPNPVNDILFVTNHTDISGILITNILGKTVKQISVDSDYVKLNVSDLLSGVYLLKISDKSGNVTVKSFVKK